MIKAHRLILSAILVLVMLSAYLVAGAVCGPGSSCACTCANSLSLSDGVPDACGVHCCLGLPDPLDTGVPHSQSFVLSSPRVVALTPFLPPPFLPPKSI